MDIIVSKHIPALAATRRNKIFSRDRSTLVWSKLYRRFDRRLRAVKRSRRVRVSAWNCEILQRVSKQNSLYIPYFLVMCIYDLLAHGKRPNFIRDMWRERNRYFKFENLLHSWKSAKCHVWVGL